MKKASILLLLLFCTLGTLLAQRKITGTVSDQDGQPLIGATVLVKGSSLGTATDIDGRYELGVPADANTLVFSYTGFQTQEITLGASNVVDVQMAAGVILDEAIVTAVGLESNRRTLGYSVQNVNADQVVGAREANLVNALNGKVAGVSVTSSSGSPGASASIRIRGANSIGRSNSPLFVVDGVPIDNSGGGSGVGGVDVSNRAIDLNPNDIGSITVLKGPAATALYGVRAANGAVIVTTKKGKEGKPTVTFAATYALDEVNLVPEMQMDYAQGVPTTGGAKIWRGPHTAEGFSFGPKIADLEFATDRTHANAPPAGAFVDGVYIFDKNGFLVPKGTGNGTPARAYDQYDFFRTGATYDANLSVQGGTDRLRYFFSAGRLASEGVVPNADWERNSLRLNTDAKLTDKLTLGASANFVTSGGSRIQRGSNVRGVMLGLLRNTPTFDMGNGKVGQEAADDRATYVLPNGGQRSYRDGVYDSPYWVVNKNPTKDNVSRFIGYASLGYDFNDWLSFAYKLGIDTYTDRQNSALDIVKSYTGSVRFPGSVNQSVLTNRDVNSDFLIKIKKEFSKNLFVNAVFGHNYFDTKGVTQTTTGNTLASPDFYHISNATTIQGFEGIGQKQLVGLYGAIDLNFFDYLFVNLTGRNDWSSALPDGNNDFQSYSVSLGWAFTEALKIQNNPILTYGKLRASYGKVGNDAPIYATSNYFGSAFSGGDGFISGIQYPAFGVNAFERSTQLGNNELKPEATTTLEFGGEFKFLKGRLGLDVTYYDSESRDQVIGVQVSSASGFTTIVQNAGLITNTGVEIVATAEPVQSSKFSWEIEANFTTYENMVEELAPGVTQIGLAGFTTPQSVVTVGQPYGAIWGTAFARDEQGRMKIDANGWPIAGTANIILGDPNPDWYGGVRNTFTVMGNLSVSALLDTRQGGDMWCGTCSILDYFGTSKASGDLRGQTVVFEGVSPDGTANTKAVPYADPTAANINGYYWARYGFGGNNEQGMYDASWIRLRELTVSYNVPTKLFGKAPFKALSLSFTGRNLWLSTDFPGVDPETNLTGDSNGFGLEYFNMPNTKSYNFGLKATF